MSRCPLVSQLLYFNSTPVSLVDLQHAVAVNLPLYFQALALLVNTALYNVLSLNFGILDIPVALVFLVALGISFVRVNKKAGYLYVMFLGSAIVIFLGFILLSLTDGLWSARFLIYTALAVFGVIALAYDEKDEKNKLNLLLLALVVVLVLSTVPANYSKMTSLDGQPNKEDYQLIAFIESRGYNLWLFGLHLCQYAHVPLEREADRQGCSGPQRHDRPIRMAGLAQMVRPAAK